MAKYEISCSMHAGTTGHVEFPDGKTWTDVEEWYVKWDSLHVQFKGAAAYVEFELNSDSLEVVDWKRPKSVEVYAVSDEGEVDYSETVAEDGP
jgi:hypothetical protein